MLKLLKLSAALSAAAVIVSLPQAVFSRPLSETSGYPTVRNSGTGSPFCYMRTQRGVTLNLENLCRADDGSGSGNRATNSPSNPANTNPAAATNPDKRVFTFTGTPGEGTNRNAANTGANTNPNAANTGANTNPNAANTGANTNPNAANTGANTNPNAANTGANTNFNAANTGANTNFNAANTGANTNPNAANTGANTNLNGANTGANTTSNGANTGANTTSNGANTGANSPIRF